MALSDFTGPHYIEDWTADLDRRWPERMPIAECVVKTILSWCKDSVRNKVRILELGVGAGKLSEIVLTALETKQVSCAGFVGIDLNPELTQHTQKTLRGIGWPNITIQNKNLNDEHWADDLAPFDIVYTFQTLHDLGGYEALAAVYQKFFLLLASGGLLVNADFVVPFLKDNPDKPRRFPIETHHQLLESVGFTQFKPELHIEKLACMSAIRP